MLAENSILEVTSQLDSSFRIVLLAISVLFPTVELALIHPIVSRESALSLIQSIFQESNIFLILLFDIEFTSFVTLLELPFELSMLFGV